MQCGQVWCRLPGNEVVDEAERNMICTHGFLGWLVHRAPDLEQAVTAAPHIAIILITQAECQLRRLCLNLL